MDSAFLTLRNYFETSHAKGRQDEVGANMKHKAYMAVIKRQVIIQNASDLYDYTKENLNKPSTTRYKSQSVGLKRRILFYVEEHQRNRRFKQIKGSRQIYSILATNESAESRLKTRRLSCYCDQCLDCDYEVCENRDFVDEWEEINIEPEGTARRITRTEVEEQRGGIRDLIL